MDKSRSRQILRVLRPHGADHLEPDAQIALEATHSDAALGAWFAREQAFDRAFAERVQTAAVPSDLRASIFATVAQETASAPTRRRVIRPIVNIDRPLATLFAALAAAASLAVLFFVALPDRPKSIGLEAIVATVTDSDFAEEVETRELAGQPVAELRTWFAGKAAPVPGELPSALATLDTAGAGIVVVKGITTSVVTFSVPDFPGSASNAVGGERRLQFFTLPRQSCSTAGISRQPVIHERGRRAVAVWRDSASIYFLAVDAPASALARFLEAGGSPATLAGPEIPPVLISRTREEDQGGEPEESSRNRLRTNFPRSV